MPWIKLAILGLVVWFVATRVDFRDRLVVRAEPGAAPASDARSPVSVVTRGGDRLALGAEEALPVEVLEVDGAAPELWVVTGERRVQVDRELVDEDGPLAIRPGLRSAMRALEGGPFLFALALFAPVPVLLAARWFLLLRAAGVVIGWAATLRLTWIGLFFNTVVPGGAGGDVVKLVEVGRHTDRRSEALGTMAVDRVLGLLVLIALGGAATLALREETGGLALAVAAAGLVLVVAGAVYLSPFLRNRIDVGRLLERLPLGSQLRRVDDAVVALRGAPGAVALALALSLVGQLLNIAAALFCARAVGLDAVSLLDMLAIVPVALVANAIPISPGGLGLLEVAFQELLYRQGLSSLAQGFMVGVLLRAISVAWSLPGLPLWMTTVRGRAVDAGRESDARGTGGSSGHGEAARPEA